MNWLFPSLINAGYEGRAHLIWYNDSLENNNYWGTISFSLWRDELLFLYKCGNKVHPLPEQYYWRLMPEYPTLRMYQFGIKED